MKVIDNHIEAFIAEKKSKFIANLYYVETAEEAEEVIKQVKKKYHDAKHNCFAYRIAGEELILEKCSDDGEPSGTAGMPILDILKGNELVNVVAVVTRYFGGILLGTGGLVRAYSDSVKKAIDEINLNEIIDGYELELLLDYKNFEVFNYYCKTNNIMIISKEYTDNIKVVVEVQSKNKEEICNNSENIKFKYIKCQILSKKKIRKIS